MSRVFKWIHERRKAGAIVSESGDEVRVPFKWVELILPIIITACLGWLAAVAAKQSEDHTRIAVHDQMFVDIKQGIDDLKEILRGKR